MTPPPSYVSTDVIEEKEKKDFDVNGVDEVNEDDDKGTNNLSSSINKNKRKKNIKRGGGGGENKRQDG